MSHLQGLFNQSVKWIANDFLAMDKIFPQLKLVILSPFHKQICTFLD